MAFEEPLLENLFRSTNLSMALEELIHNSNDTAPSIIKSGELE